MRPTLDAPTLDAPTLHAPGRRRLTLSRPARPVWSARSFAVGGLLVVAFVTVPALLLGDRAITDRLAWAATLVATLLWLFLFVGLYRGARLRRAEPTPAYTPATTTDASDVNAIDALGGVGEACDDLVGGIVALALWIVVGIALIFLLPLVIEGLAYLLFVLVAGLSWIARRALRQVFAHGRHCRGRVVPSAARAAAFTLLYVGWLFAVLWLAGRATHT